MCRKNCTQRRQCRTFGGIAFVLQKTHWILLLFCLHLEHPKMSIDCKRGFKDQSSQVVWGGASWHCWRLPRSRICKGQWESLRDLYSNHSWKVCQLPEKLWASRKTGFALDITSRPKIQNYAQQYLRHLCWEHAVLYTKLLALMKMRD